MKQMIAATLRKMNRVRKGMYKPNAVTLLCMIAAHESHAGKYRKQIGGIALGLYQIEPETHDSIWDNSDTINEVADALGITRDVSKLENDDFYSTFVARHYLAMDKNKLPTDIVSMAVYCKSYWNRTGKATPEKYLNDYENWLKKNPE